MASATRDDLNLFVTTNVEPCYCSVILQRSREVVIEGWLLMTTKADILLIQPSVAYDPEVTTLPILMEDVISITPSFPPIPYQPLATAAEAADDDYYNPKRGLLSATDVVKFTQEFLRV